ncbi:MAG TPA: transposase [Polyangiaceae bacterium]|nr:transposase [Polyangiaceae bacterium]
MKQIDIEFSEHGGARDNAGRPRGVRPKARHRTRERHRRAHPVHVTMRARDGLPSLREPVLMREVMRRIRVANASGRLRHVFRVVHFSIQDDHVHLIVESDNDALSRGVQGLAIRIARHVNALLRTRGSLWGDRFHSRELASPRAVRNAIVYVLMNVKKHHRRWGDSVDPCSSAPWFFSVSDARDSPVRDASTWLAGVGWRRHGPIRVHERPRAPS